MQNQDVKFISKINRETKEGAIVWQKINIPPDSLLDSEMIMGGVYITQVKNKNLRLYRLQQRSYTDEDTFHWIINFRLEFVDAKNKNEWTFPDDKATRDLYESVQYKVANVEEFFDDYLEGEPDELENNPW